MPTRIALQLPPRAPLSTYRLQLNLNLTFRDAAEIVPYLHALGISDLYASPCLQARPGSLHGYDISDHGRLNPELGGEEEYDLLAAALRQHGMGQLLDIVPNHMGIGEPGNRWWMDVLENGQCSPYAPYFDIDWNPLHTGLHGKVLLPVLGDQFGRILENGELRLFFEDGRFRLAYHEHVFPVSPRSASIVLRGVHEEMSKRVPEDDVDLIELESIVSALEHLPSRDKTDQASIAERRRESFVTRRRLTALMENSEAFRTALEIALEKYNGRPGDPRSFDLLERVLDEQAYRLAYWRVAAEEINYRRFFDINHLAGVRVEKGEVFEATHRLILQLIAEGKVTALRVDHPDGLFDPHRYLKQLQAEASRHAGETPVYILVEKILTGEEPLPPRWPVAGTVGYEFLNRVNSLFVASDNAEAMTRVYEEFTGVPINFSRLVYEKKKLILRVALASELNVLAFLLNRISEKNRRFRDFTLGSLTDALRETIACFPVYRSYIDAFSGSVAPSDVEHVDRAIRGAIRRNRAMSPSIFEFIRNILLLKWPDDLDDDSREEHAMFVMKFQQLTGPVMAKAVEDTSFYIYNRLVSLNEVGGEPDRFGIDPDHLHAWIAERAREWPAAMNSTTTHDTKRSEDVRARIDVLSEMPEEWRARVWRWAEMNATRKPIVDGDPVPDRNDEYLLYQTLVGTYPLQPPGPEESARYRERIQQYMQKATREAKVHTSWINPNEEFDTALHVFIDRLLNPESPGATEFLEDLREFSAEVSRYGMINSLAQVLIKMFVPGVPDIYQGQELWDFSLVDPDNRRPVDFEFRRRMLSDLRQRMEEDRRALVKDLLANWEDGRIKMYVTHVALLCRRERAELARIGDYVPLRTAGVQARHLFTFARWSAEEGIVVVAVPRLCRIFERETGGLVTTPSAWGDTRIQLSELMGARQFRNLFTDERIGGDELRAAELFADFPVALLGSA